MSPTPSHLLAFVALVAFSSGCGRNNGLPDDLTEHLAGHGITVGVVEAEAPLSSRSGLLRVEGTPGFEQAIVAALGLEPIERASPEFERVAERLPVPPGSLWGASGRPPALRLADGGQLEYLYLCLTEDGSTYLLAEYAYG